MRYGHLTCSRAELGELLEEPDAFPVLRDGVGHACGVCWVVVVLEGCPINGDWDEDVGGDGLLLIVRSGKHFSCRG